MRLLLGRILGERYELVEKIGSGGMANVYKARCHLLKRFVAVKVLRPDLVEDDEFVSRFKRESQAAASLSHPNIVNVYDVGEEEGIHYIVMEYVKGKTLKELIKEKSPMDYDEAVKITLQICMALKLAHKNNIVHRDIKPQNILISDDGTVKVADFGIARAVTSSTVTLAGANVIGSVHYFSPEQARGAYVDAKSDIYSLGIVLYEMLTGNLPFEGDSAISVALKHIQEEVVPPGQLNPNIPKSLQDIVEKAIEKDQSKRYQNVDEMIKDLQLSLKDPKGNFVVKKDIMNQSTQIIKPVVGKDHNKSAAARKGTKNIWKILLKTIIPSIILIFLIFRLANLIYNNNFAPGEVDVPDIIDYSEIDAERILRDNRLSMKIIDRRYSSDIAKGHIIFQDPAPPMKVKIDSEIKVIVSEGPETILVPDFVNKTKKQAEQELENLDLDPEFTYEYNNYPIGTIFKQSPLRDVEVSPGTKITLWVSNGPETQRVKVRNYTEMLLEVAKEMIIADKLKVGNIEDDTDPNSLDGIVTRQSPMEGDYVDENTPVDLWVNRISPILNLNELVIDLSSDMNKETVHVMVKQIQNEQQSIIYDQLHSVSEEKIIIPINGTGKVEYEIYFDGQLKKKTVRNFSDTSKREDVI